MPQFDWRNHLPSAIVGGLCVNLILSGMYCEQMAVWEMIGLFVIGWICCGMLMMTSTARAHLIRAGEDIRAIHPFTFQTVAALIGFCAIIARSTIVCM